MQKNNKLQQILISENTEFWSDDASGNRKEARPTDFSQMYKIVMRLRAGRKVRHLGHLNSGAASDNMYTDAT